MVRLFGREYSRRELLDYTGNLTQIGGIRPLELMAGRERGVRGFDVCTGSGFEFTVLADRALDISNATYRGQSLCFLSPAGQAHPSYYEPGGMGWLKTFSGGLVSTCGMRFLGSPEVDEGEICGLHGRIGNLPAEELGFWTEWQDDECRLCIQGTVTEALQFGSSLRLTRKLSANLGGNSVLIEDSVENLGAAPAPHMMLYHCNAGFPLLSPAAALIANSARVTPRDKRAAPGMDTWMEMQAPANDAPEAVYYHDMVADNAGDVRLALINPHLDNGLGLSITYHEKNLPNFVQWKQMTPGTYVLGLEPSNCGVEGRSIERARGTLQVLQPGETRHYRLEIGVLDGMANIEEFTRKIRFPE